MYAQLYSVDLYDTFPLRDLCYFNRECVATFLTRGDLWINWEYGKDVFEHLLLDFEPAVSCGCWMKSSCSAFLTGPVEHFCPITFGMKIDPHGSYIRKYIPELRNYPGTSIAMTFYVHQIM